MKKINCPVCTKENNKYLFNSKDILHGLVKKDFKILECINCKAQFINPFPTKEEAIKFYPKTYFSYQKEQTEGGGLFENS